MSTGAHPNDPPTLMIWLPATGYDLEAAIKASLVRSETPFDRLVVILDETCSRQGGTGSHQDATGSRQDKRGFAYFYWLLRDTYKMVLGRLSPADGLRVDLQVFIYPQYCCLAGFDGAERLAVVAGGCCSVPPSLPAPLLVELAEAAAPAARLHGDFDGIGVRSFPVVALGGTFDRLHAGHKLMLSSAVLLAQSRVVVGLTDASMLASKKLVDRILSFGDRHAVVRAFLRAFAGPSRPVGLDIVKLTDAYGPTITEPEMDVLVVSEETLPGAEQINKIREQKGMHPLLVVPVEFVKLSSGERISSSLIRSQAA